MVQIFKKERRRGLSSLVTNVLLLFFSAIAIFIIAALVLNLVNTGGQSIKIQECKLMYPEGNEYYDCLVEKFGVSKASELYGGDSSDFAGFEPYNFKCKASIEDGLVGYYCFDFNYLDSSSNKNDGIDRSHNYNFGRVEYGAFLMNGFLVFDDSSNYVEVNHVDKIKDKFTMSFWLNGKTIEKSDGGDYNSYQIIEKGDNKVNYFKSNDKTKESYIQFSSTHCSSSKAFLKRENGWNFISLAVSSGSYEVYVDGEIATSGLCQENAISDDSFLIGQNFMGQLDNLILYDRLLESNEINQIYSETKEMFSDVRENIIPSCGGGCLVEGNYYSYGYRDDESLTFCSEEGTFINQLELGDDCNEDFECSSDICSPIGKCAENRNTNDCRTDIANGLIAHYCFENNFNDASSMNNHATLRGNVDFDKLSTGSFHAKFFGQQNSYLESNANKDLVDTKKGMTISFWLKNNNNPYLNRSNSSMGYNDYSIIGNSRAVQQYGGYKASNFDVQYHENKNPKKSSYVEFISNGCGATSGFIPNDGEWHNIVVKREDTRVVVYVDAKIGTGQTCISNVFSKGIPILIGADSGNLQGHIGGWLKGSIDELMIYNRNLDDEEIEKLYYEKKNLFFGSQKLFACGVKCNLNGNYYNYGYRDEVNANYCGDKSNFVNMREKDSYCYEDFECVSNICSPFGKCMGGDEIALIGGKDKYLESLTSSNSFKDNDLVVDFYDNVYVVGAQDGVIDSMYSYPAISDSSLEKIPSDLVKINYVSLGSSSPSSISNKITSSKSAAGKAISSKGVFGSGPDLVNLLFPDCNIEIVKISHSGASKTNSIEAISGTVEYAGCYGTKTFVFDTEWRVKGNGVKNVVWECGTEHCKKDIIEFDYANKEELLEKTINLGKSGYGKFDFSFYIGVPYTGDGGVYFVETKVYEKDGLPVDSFGSEIGIITGNEKYFSQSNPYIVEGDPDASCFVEGESLRENQWTVSQQENELLGYSHSCTQCNDEGEDCVSGLKIMQTNCARDNNDCLLRSREAEGTFLKGCSYTGDQIGYCDLVWESATFLVSSGAPSAPAPSPYSSSSDRERAVNLFTDGMNTPRGIFGNFELKHPSRGYAYWSNKYYEGKNREEELTLRLSQSKGDERMRQKLAAELVQVKNANTKFRENLFLSAKSLGMAQGIYQSGIYSAYSRNDGLLNGVNNCVADPIGLSRRNSIDAAKGISVAIGNGNFGGAANSIINSLTSRIPYVGGAVESSFKCSVCSGVDTGRINRVRKEAIDLITSDLYNKFTLEGKSLNSLGEKERFKVIGSNVDPDREKASCDAISEKINELKFLINCGGCN